MTDNFQHVTNELCTKVGIDLERKTFELIKHEFGLSHFTYRMYKAQVNGLSCSNYSSEDEIKSNSDIASSGRKVTTSKSNQITEMIVHNPRNKASAKPKLDKANQKKRKPPVLKESRLAELKR